MYICEFHLCISVLLVALLFENLFVQISKETLCNLSEMASLHMISEQRICPHTTNKYVGKKLL